LNWDSHYRDEKTKIVNGKEYDIIKKVYNLIYSKIDNN